MLSSWGVGLGALIPQASAHEEQVCSHAARHEMAEGGLQQPARMASIAGCHAIFCLKKCHLLDSKYAALACIFRQLSLARWKWVLEPGCRVWNCWCSHMGVKVGTEISSECCGIYGWSSCLGELPALLLLVLSQGLLKSKQSDRADQEEQECSLDCVGHCLSPEEKSFSGNILTVSAAHI